jgi:RNA polymerase sigma-70 factor (ECF subfamily)
LDEFGERAAACIPRLRRYARALAGERLAADDLVQDTLERALVKRHLWQPGSDLRAWMFTIMHNVYVNQVRSRAAEAASASVTLDDAIHDLAAPVSSIDLLDVADLDAALRQLPPEQREVLLLVGLEELSYAETAQALGVPIGTVMSRLHRARERLRVLTGGEPVAGTLKVVK